MSAEQDRLIALLKDAMRFGHPLKNNKAYAELLAALSQPHASEQEAAPCLHCDGTGDAFGSFACEHCYGTGKAAPHAAAPVPPLDVHAWNESQREGPPTPDEAVPPLQGAEDWRIDTSAGSPILVYKNCSVIEGEQARYVLSLIAADRAASGEQAPALVQAAPTEPAHGSREWFLQQQGKVREDMQQWPQFMKDGNVVATASFPAPPAPVEADTLTDVCAHNWHDYGRLGGRNVSWCSRCDRLAWTGQEHLATPARAIPATPAQARSALEVRAVEELCQLGYTVRNGLLYPPETLATPLPAQVQPAEQVGELDRYINIYNAWALLKAERNEEALAVLSKLIGADFMPAPHQPVSAEARDVARYRLLRDWCVRQHKLYVTDGNNPVYEDELDRRLDAALTPPSHPDEPGKGGAR